MSKKKKVKNTVRKHLFEADIEVLMELRGIKHHKFAPVKDTNPVVYRPRTTATEWRAILKARKQKIDEENRIPKETQDYVTKIYNNQSLLAEEKEQILSEHFRVAAETIRDWAHRLRLSTFNSQFAIARVKHLKKSKRYIISSAQNASPANLELLRNMEAYAKYIGAEIGIIATRYRNPTSVWHSKDAKNDWWDNAVHPYLTAKRQTLHKHLELLSDLKIQATSPSPTSGIELFGDDRSVIVGSPRIEMRSVPTLIEEEQKFLYSTGTVTVPSFTDSVAGGKAKEHHSFGFIVVEIESDNVVHTRQVSAHSNGAFSDLIFRVENQQIKTKSVGTMVWGDSHFAQKDEDVTAACRKMCVQLGIDTSVLHDIWDSEAMSVHNIKDAIRRHELEMEGKDDLQKELNQAFHELDWFENNMDSTIVVASNHDDMLDRSMLIYDWKTNLKNAKIFTDLLRIKLSGQADDGLIAYMINDKFKKIIALGIDDSYVKNGVQLGLHGHKGANGSRGNINGFAKLSAKTIIGHSHSPGIKWGCYQVGVSCALQHHYNKGLSSWAYANVLLNTYGKRQMIVLNRNTLSYTTLLDD